jgi:hypothetical protein
MENVELNEDDTNELADCSNELIEFIEYWEMGAFYGKRIRELIGRKNGIFLMKLGEGSDPAYERSKREDNFAFRNDLIKNREAAETLIVELLRYQKWADV